MFTTTKNKSYRESFGYRASKATSKKRASFKERDFVTPKRITIPPPLSPPTKGSSCSSPTSPGSPVVNISVGHQQRMFAAHEDLLFKSSWFAQHSHLPFPGAGEKRVDLANEDPYIFSKVLEYLYRGDYTPNIDYDKKRGTWYLQEDEEYDGEGDRGAVYHDDVAGPVLKDTLIYCAAARYHLPELQRLALKKQGLQSSIACSTILSSARFAYMHTPPSDSKLRAHYLALIIRSRHTFKRSGTMQMEMHSGGTPLFFDLFVALVNHLDDLAGAKSPH